MSPTGRMLAAGIASIALGADDAAAQPTLGACTGPGSMSLTISTNTTSGWTVNGVPAIAVSNAAWVNVPLASWIGQPGTQPAVQDYVVHFQQIGHHSNMHVDVRWAADNCGRRLKAGSGAWQQTGPCYAAPSPNGKDFMYANHSTSANFSPADGNDPNPAIRFRTANQPGSSGGFAGAFFVTAQCP